MASQWYGKYCTYSYENNKKYRINTVADPGPPYFQTKVRPEGQKNFFGRPPLLSKGLDDQPPPYLEVWIWLCNK